MKIGNSQVKSELCIEDDTIPEMSSPQVFRPRACDIIELEILETNINEWMVFVLSQKLVS